MKKYDEIIKKKYSYVIAAESRLQLLTRVTGLAFLDVRKAWGIFQSGMAVSTIFIYVKNAMKK